MRNFCCLCGCIVVTTFGLAAVVSALDPSLEFAGWPLVSVSQGGARGWIAIGQYDAYGVIVIAQNGYGLVAFTQGGVGLILGVGQLIGGLVVIGQVGAGLIFFLGQLGVGTQAIGQVAFFGRQGAWFSEMNEEIGVALRPPWR